MKIKQIKKSTSYLFIIIALIAASSFLFAQETAIQENQNKIECQNATIFPLMMFSDDRRRVNEDSEKKEREKSDVIENNYCNDDEEDAVALMQRNNGALRISERKNVTAVPFAFDTAVSERINSCQQVSSLDKRSIVMVNIGESIKAPPLEDLRHISVATVQEKKEVGNFSGMHLDDITSHTSQKSKIISSQPREEDPLSVAKIKLTPEEKWTLDLEAVQAKRSAHWIKIKIPEIKEALDKIKNETSSSSITHLNEFQVYSEKRKVLGKILDLLKKLPYDDPEVVEIIKNTSQATEELCEDVSEIKNKAVTQAQLSPTGQIEIGLSAASRICDGVKRDFLRLSRKVLDYPDKNIGEVLKKCRIRRASDRWSFAFSEHREAIPLKKSGQSSASRTQESVRKIVDVGNDYDAVEALEPIANPQDARRAAVADMVEVIDFALTSMDQVIKILASNQYDHEIALDLATENIKAADELYQTADVLAGKRMERTPFSSSNFQFRN